MKGSREIGRPNKMWVDLIKESMRECGGNGEGQEDIRRPNLNVVLFRGYLYNLNIPGT